jgi:predicted O-methyltransferase YrrM
MQRLSRSQPTTPWIASPAVAFLNDSINGTWNIFEFGSGASTAWYARRAGNVESVENNAEWHRQVSQQLADSGVTNCLLTWLDSSEEFPGYLERFDNDSFDLIVVDGHEPWPGHRLECLKVARTKVKPGGLILLDDSDRPEYRGADELVPGWAVERFIAVKPFPFAAVETSIFRRPFDPANRNT